MHSGAWCFDKEGVHNGELPQATLKSSSNYCDLRWKELKLF